MRLINLQCAGDNLNTGIQSCSWNPSNITGAIHVPKGKSYNATDVAVLWTTLQNDIKEENQSDRIYPIGAFKAITDNSTEVQIETDGYGGQTFVRDGDYNWTFEYKNGMCFYKALRTFHTKNSSFDVLFIDEVNNVLWGTENADGDLQGFSLELLIVPNIKINDGSASTKYMITYGLADPTELNDNSYAVSFPSNQKLMKLSGLLDIVLTVSTTDYSTETLTATVKSSCGAIDLVELYPTEITTIGAGSIWDIYNVTDGNSVLITACTSDPMTGVVTLTIDQMYVSVGAKLSVSIGTIVQMTNAGILGYSSSKKVTSIVVP
jgi:hypothetical protein